LETGLFRVACTQQVATLERLFGRRLRPWWLWQRRLRVYLFRSVEEVSRVYGAPAGGFANWDHWLIVVNVETDWGEILRHELAHIFAGRWNPRAPTVLREGLAVWAQRTIARYPIDDCARSLLCGSAAALQQLIGPEPALGSIDRHRYYVLAGSFTAALIRRFGLRRYQQLYRDRLITRASLELRFERHFAVSLRSAVDRWLSALLGRRAHRC
jgi:hypothetical protein